LKQRIIILEEEIDSSKKEQLKIKDAYRKSESKFSDISKIYDKYKLQVIKSLEYINQWVIKFKPNLTISQPTKELKGI